MDNQYEAGTSIYWLFLTSSSKKHKLQSCTALPTRVSAVSGLQPLVYFQKERRNGRRFGRYLPENYSESSREESL